MKKNNVLLILFSLMIVACGQEGSGNLTVSGGVVSSSSSVLLPLSDQMGFSGPEILADTGINPTSFMMTVYKVGFSKNTDCTDMSVITIESPEAANWVNSPNLVQGNLDDGNYPCVAFEVNTTIQITPESSSDTGNCVADQEFSQVVGSSGSSTLLDGTTADLSQTDQMAVYISTTGLSDESCGQGCGLSPGNPILLSSALVVDGAKQGQFTVDAQNSLQDSNGSCDMSAPSWGFQ